MTYYLTEKHANLLNELFHATSDGKFLTLYDLEIVTGMTGEALRSYLEDLKNQILVVEHQEGFQISREGRNYAASIWG